MNDSNRLDGYWSIPTDRLYGLLTTTADGISEEEAGVRLKRYGSNSLASKRKLSPLKLLAEQFKSPIIILVVTTLISAVVKDRTDAVIILGIVLLYVVASEGIKGEFYRRTGY